jgi:DNA-binding LytR/AlgR family response regulator
MTFTSGEALLKQVQDGVSFDVYFLDIEMPKVNGLYLSGKIRVRNENALIVFISNREELVFQSFRVRPFRFLRKSHFEEELPTVIDALSREFGRSGHQSLVFHELNSTNVYSVHPREIKYIEARGKSCRVVTSRGEFSLHYRFGDMEKQTANLDFLRPHRSYLVNFAYVFNLGQSTLTLDDGTEIPISRRRLQNLRDNFARMASMI